MDKSDLEKDEACTLFGQLEVDVIDETDKAFIIRKY